MNLTSTCCALALFLLAPTLAAQSPPPKDSAASDPRLVQPERPTIATHAGTVARGFVELEDGGEWDNVRTDGRSFFARGQAADRHRGRGWNRDDGFLVAAHLQPTAWVRRDGPERRRHAPQRERKLGTNIRERMDRIVWHPHPRTVGRRAGAFRISGHRRSRRPKRKCVDSRRPNVSTPEMAGARRGYYFATDGTAGACGVCRVCLERWITSGTRCPVPGTRNPTR